ncbi:MAG: aa3-type cytochrome c oxidase subunit IV [Alphaproteobacteria bacterium]|nr:aa3-type cytochrome c oxidase subunit IV [Alphaproteobacteria bacterium]
MTVDSDYQEHLATYKSFTKLFTVGTALCVVTLALMALFLL